MDSGSFTKDEIEKAIIQAKETGKYIGFDLPFILENAPKIEYELLENTKVVIIAELIHSLLDLRDKKDFRAKYAFNLIYEISKTGNLTVIPETRYPTKFKEYLHEWNLSFNNPLHQIIGYYLKLQDEFDFEILLLSGDHIEEAVRETLPLHLL
ncbi:hypothetical protein [Virgibacillus halodenitrificans]|uniref:hypothetical protein n=1 Tax=Virgibacillus halodenitrificans TaxID=1482 RepID=UPI000EF49429|nr:hypothetical protein [Virgibacillus halodenitrificans]